MKRKPVLIILISILFLLQLTVSSHAFWNRDVKKAKEFMEVDMYPEAIELLNKRINEKPKDAEAHLLLGMCYLHQKNYSVANVSFKRAVKLNFKYRQQIGVEYKQLGYEAVRIGKNKLALDLFNKAISYNSILSQEIAKVWFETGKSKLNVGLDSFSFFQLAVNYDKELSNNVCDIYYNKGKSSSGRKKILYYKNAMMFCSVYNNDINKELASINLTPNPSFEKGIEEPFGWHKNALSGKGNISWENKVAHSGEHSLSISDIKISSKQKNAWLAWETSEFISINPNHQYKLSLWYRNTTNLIGQFYIIIGKGEGSFAYLALEPTNDWTYKSKIYIIKKFFPKAKKVQLSFRAYSEKNEKKGNIWIDDISFIDTTPFR